MPLRAILPAALRAALLGTALAACAGGAGGPPSPRGYGGPTPEETRALLDRLTAGTMDPRRVEGRTPPEIAVLFGARGFTVLFEIPRTPVGARVGPRRRGLSPAGLLESICENVEAEWTVVQDAGRTALLVAPPARIAAVEAADPETAAAVRTRRASLATRRNPRGLALTKGMTEPAARRVLSTIGARDATEEFDRKAWPGGSWFELPEGRFIRLTIEAPEGREPFVAGVAEGTAGERPPGRLRPWRPQAPAERLALRPYRLVLLGLLQDEFKAGEAVVPRARIGNATAEEVSVDVSATEATMEVVELSFAPDGLTGGDTAVTTPIRFSGRANGVRLKPNEEPEEFPDLSVLELPVSRPLGPFDRPGTLRIRAQGRYPYRAPGEGRESVFHLDEEFEIRIR